MSQNVESKESQHSGGDESPANNLAVQNVMASSVISSCSSTFSTASSSSSNLLHQTTNVISEKVASLAAAIYQELEIFVREHGEENVRMLMSLVISTLESLDSATQEREERETEIELLKEDREQLLTQWERERQLRKRSDEKYLVLEDLLEEQRRLHEEAIEASEKSLKLADIKLRNAVDHVARLEEKEAETQRNYTKLHEKYNELFKFHCEYVERTKSTMSGVDILSTSRNFRNNSGRMSNDSSPVLDSSVASSKDACNRMSSYPITRLSSKNSRTTPLTVQQEQRKNIGFPLDIAFMEFEDKNADFDLGETRTMTSSEDDIEACSICEETSDSADGALNSSIFGMTRELDKLISENNDLLATKNALNVLKDDLLEKINELSGKLKFSQKEIASLEEEKQRNRLRICQLESQLRLLQSKENDQTSESVDKKFFTRAEMSRVLVEKNIYKQKFMDLEDAIKWQEMMRITKLKPPQTNTRKRSRIWQMFSTLFAPNLIATPNNSLTQFDETNNLSPKSITEEKINFRHEPKERSIVDDWMTPKCCTINLPSYRGFTAFPRDDIEQIRCHVNFNDQMWLAGPITHLPNTSRIVIIDYNHLTSDRMSIRKQFQVDSIVGAMCYVPYPNKENVLYSRCEYCRREEKVPPGISSQKLQICQIDSGTVWLGAQDGLISVWSVDDFDKEKCVHNFRLNSSILAMQHKQSSVVCGLSNGSIAVLHVNKEGLWTTQHHLICLSTGGEAVRALCFMNNGKLWAGVRNQVSCIDDSLTVEKVFDIHPRRSSQIRNIVTVKDIAVISIRLDSTLRVFHSETSQHLHDIDLDPLERTVVNLSGGHTGLSLVRVTAIDFGPDNQLYVGTSNGNIISIPSAWTKAGRCRAASANSKNMQFLLEDHSIISIRSHKKDVQCFCSLAQGLEKVILSFGSGYRTQRHSTDTESTSPNEVSSKSVCCIAWDITTNAESPSKQQLN